MDNCINSPDQGLYSIEHFWSADTGWCCPACLRFQDGYSWGIMNRVQIEELNIHRVKMAQKIYSSNADSAARVSLSQAVYGLVMPEPAATATATTCSECKGAGELMLWLRMSPCSQGCRKP